MNKASIWLMILLPALTSAPVQAVTETDVCDIPVSVRRNPPSAEGGPTIVTVGIVLIDLFEVSDAAQTFEADLVYTLQWKDPRLSAAARGGPTSDCAVQLTDIWHPDLRAVNLRDQIGAWGEAVKIDDDGTVHYEREVLGEFSSTLNLRQFPFDRQLLRIKVASFQYGPDKVKFIVRKPPGMEGHARSIAGWALERSYTEPSVEPIRVGFEEFSRFDHIIVVKRQAAYYLWNFVVPLSFIVFMAWGVLWLDPEQAGIQIGIATGATFTLIAFLIALRSRLPPVPYLTRMDQLILGSTVLVFTALGQAVLTSRLAQREQAALARRIDSYGRWVYAAAFTLVLYVTLVR